MFQTEQQAAELAKPEEASHTAMQLAAMVLSDCGISADNTALLMVVAARIMRHEEQLIDSLKKLSKPVERVETVAWVVLAELDGSMVPQYPPRRDRESAEQDARMYGKTKTIIRPLCLHPPTPAWHDAPEVAALKAERDALLKDAERYQWLRSQHWSDGQLSVVVNAKANVRLGANCPSHELLDAAIDAAMKGAP